MTVAQGTLEELRERVKQHNVRALPVNPLVNDLWAEVAALSAQVVELQKDAERYRWLRDNPDEQLWSLLADINEGPSEEQPEFDNSANAWDAAIDAAIRALPDQKG